MARTTPLKFKVRVAKASDVKAGEFFAVGHFNTDALDTIPEDHGVIGLPDGIQLALDDFNSADPVALARAENVPVAIFEVEPRG